MQLPDNKLQLRGPKVPPSPPSEKVSTVPVGVVVVPVFVSLTVTVHIVATLTSVVGQSIDVDVDLVTMFSEKAAAVLAE